MTGFESVVEEAAIQCLGNWLPFGMLCNCDWGVENEL